jgi:hypothetical protein
MAADEINDPVPPVSDGTEAEGLDESLDDSEWSDEDTDDSRRGTFRAIAAAIVLVIVVILVLLLLRMCGTSTTATVSGDKSIVPVPAQVRQENAVSVWLKPKNSLLKVLADAGARPTSTRSMGQGLYFVFLADGQDGAAIVRRLKADDRVYDAGFVYDETKVSPASGTP